ncbi:MAG: formylglycine-generating enzyme family protein [Magnetococcales bacterium]|nr:formylglycine-generating enzyme family protein [Magnetococcales bacterium]
MTPLLQEIRKHLDKGNYRHPLQVRFALVGSLLHQLGWNLANPLEVNSLLEMAGDRPGPGLPLGLTPGSGGAPAVILEVTPPGSLAKGAAPEPRPGTRFYVQTDGRTWRFFYQEPDKTRPETCFKVLDLIQNDLSEVENVLTAFLSREAHATGSAEGRMEKKRAQGLKKKFDPMRRILPKARAMADKPPNPPLEKVLLAYMTKAGILVTPDEVRQFLEMVAQEQKPVADIAMDLIVGETPQKKEWVEPVTGMVFLWVPKGSFLMGSPEDEAGRHINEGPVHKVTLDGFWLARTPVTLAQWRKVMDSDTRQSSWARRPKSPEEQEREEKEQRLLELKGDFPMETVLLEEVTEFIQQLGLLGGDASKLRLPTEAEWEYACRAGTTSPYPFEGDPRKVIDDYCWYNVNSKGQVQKVGQKKPNAWGFHDMLGNVWEWVSDGFRPYREEPTVNPTGPGSDDASFIPIRRGGSARSTPKACRPARRNNVKVDDMEAKNSGGLGFRLAKSG